MTVTTSHTEFALYGIWEGVCSLLGITGNILLLYTFLTYPLLIRLDYVSTTIMKNLAVVDLLSALFIPSTLSVSYLAGYGTFWPMSDAWCGIYTYLKHGPTVASILFIMSFSLYRLFRCGMPFRSRGVDEHMIACVITIVAWGLTVLVPVYMMYFELTDHLAVQYVNGEELYGACDFVDVIHPANKSARPKAVLAVCIIILPGIITTVSNTILLAYVLGRPVKPTIRTKTTIFITSIFILSYFPYATVILISSATTVAPGRVVRHLAARCVSVGCWYNLPIYLFLDRKLRGFMARMLVAAARCRKVPPPVSARMRFRGAAVGVTAAIKISKVTPQRTPLQITSITANGT